MPTPMSSVLVIVITLASSLKRESTTTLVAEIEISEALCSTAGQKLGFSELSFVV